MLVSPQHSCGHAHLPTYLAGERGRRACLVARWGRIRAAVVAILKPDGQHARHGLVDVLVAVQHRLAIVPQHLVQDLHERLILAQNDPAAATRFRMPLSSIHADVPCKRVIGLVKSTHATQEPLASIDDQTLHVGQSCLVSVSAQHGGRPGCENPEGFASGAALPSRRIFQ